MTNVTPLRPPSRRFDDFRAGGSDGTQSEMFPGAARVWIDDAAWSETDIPRRDWIAPGYLMRGAVTVVSGPGSAGKSMLTVLWAVAIALNVRIGRFLASPGCRTLIYNVEDNAHEQRRRISAALRQFRATPADLEDRLHRAGPVGVGTLFRVDPITKRLGHTAALAELRAHLTAFPCDVVFLDPMVELHDSEENDNTSIRAVMAELRSIAVEFSCAVCLLHHSRKGTAGSAGDPDSLRGASAIVGAARVVLTVLTMDEDEAKAISIPSDRRRDYFRLDGAKSNYARVEDAEWFQRVEHELANGERVAAATPWTPPTVFQDVTPMDCNRALDLIAAGPRDGVLYAAHKRGRSNDRWAGQVLVDQFGISDEQAGSMIRAWLKSGLLAETTFRDPELRKDRTGVVVIDAKRPTE